MASKSKFLNAVDWLTSLRRDAAYYKLETVEYSNSDVMQSLDLEDGWGRCFCFFWPVSLDTSQVSDRSQGGHNEAAEVAS